MTYPIIKTIYDIKPGMFYWWENDKSPAYYFWYIVDVDEKYDKVLTIRFSKKDENPSIQMDSCEAIKIYTNELMFLIPI